MSTKMISGPIWQMFLKGMTTLGSQFKKFRILLFPGTMILQIQPLHGSNSRSHTFPSFLQSLVLITSLHFSSENSILSRPSVVWGDSFSMYYMLWPPRYFRNLEVGFSLLGICGVLDFRRFEFLALGSFAALDFRCFLISRNIFSPRAHTTTVRKKRDSIAACQRPAAGKACGKEET